MNRWMRIAWVMAALGSACEPVSGNGVGLSEPAGCQLMPTLANEARVKLGTCAVSKNSEVESYLSLNPSRCQDMLSKCAKSDVEDVDTFLGCLRELPACTPATESAFIAKAQECRPKLSRLSSACFEALK
jgi:hypothetical protein